LDGDAIRSCVTPLSRAAGKSVTTVEGLSKRNAHAVQQAWLAEQVPQCGYCQSGQLMSAAVLLAKIPRPTDADIDDAMSGNICRCGTYQRIRRAIHRAAEIAGKNKCPEHGASQPQRSWRAFPLPACSWRAPGKMRKPAIRPVCLHFG